mmetsp:Transcript_25474/g.37581  ORF Transcript_25474/g.37581 Transcript_25474/m.37581 type:complete len:625 (+) Transcript_25474:69-1943(+)|eukprot:CAMPEP_0185023852 /NCGR_PEP_ID=MMETSP1103-20130426/6474_1 /TAXON_ID=36769 /ORGANISM="Paraphysomonas bandaiensis, Strain Caron Lab Isolate" /LENGTH=624 /DNA_ID=CAMNT_0027556623 /DNA_START=75 /DNA_END=1949 /DNA_ORIENTATION=+
MSAFASGANAFLSSPFLEKTIGPNPSTVRGSTTHIYAHPREPRIIYPSGKYIIVKNLEDPSDCFIYRGHSQPTTVAKFSPNGYWVASADSSGKLRVWSWDNPEHMTKLELPVFAGEIKDLDWDFESKKICAVGDGSPLSAKVFTWDTGNSVGELVGHSKRVTSVAFKPSRPFRIMTGSEDMKTMFYAGPPFKHDHSNAPHTNFVNCIRYTANGERAVSVGSDKKIQLYDGKTGEPNGEIVDAHAGSIYSVSTTPDSAKMLTTSADKTAKLWDLSSLTCEQTFNPRSGWDTAELGDMQVGALCTSSHLLSLSLNGNINYLDPGSSTPVRVVQGHQVAITAMTVDRERGMLYTGSYDGVVCATDLTNGICNRLLGTDKRNVSGAAHGGMLTGLAVSGDSLLSIGWDDTIRTANLSSGSYVKSSATNGQPCGICSTSAGLVALATLSEVVIYNGDEKVAAVGNLSYNPTCVSLLGGDEVAVGGSDNKTHVYSIADGALTEIATIETRSKVSAVAYSPLGDALAIGDEGRQVEVYERGTWEARVKGRWVFHTSKITCLAWSPSGNLLASGSLDENIYVWNCSNPQTKQHLPFSHMSGVTGVGWLNEERLISCGNDHVIVWWKIPQAAV